MGVSHSQNINYIQFAYIQALVANVYRPSVCLVPL